jgi:zinc protease
MCLIRVLRPMVLPLSGLAGITGIAERAEAAEFPYPVHQRTLDNGLRVYVVELHGSRGAAAVATWMSVGSGAEVEAGRTGFAHFFEHLMFHGTEDLSGDERDRELLRLGAVDNAWTWLDETVYHAAIPTSSLGRLLEIEADRFQNLALTPAGVQKEAGAVYGEFRRWQADPQTVLEQRLAATAFRTHPYGHLTLGLEADIAAMPGAHDHAEAFFARHYRPEQAALLVVGDVEPEPVFEQVEATFGAWAPAPAPPPPAIPEEPPQEETRRATVEWPGAAAPMLAMGWRMGEVEAPAALQLAADLLLARTGPLHRRLVREEGFAFRVMGGRDDTVDPGLFRVVVEATAPEHLPRIEAIVREEVAAMAGGVDAERLESLRTHLRQQFRSSLDDPMTVLHVVGSALRRDPDPAALDRYREALAATPAAAVSAAVQAHLVDEALTVVTLVPAADSASPEAADDPVE